jgi:hypothetical protein
MPVLHHSKALISHKKMMIIEKNEVPSNGIMPLQIPKIGENFLKV